MLLFRKKWFDLDEPLESSYKTQGLQDIELIFVIGGYDERHQEFLKNIGSIFTAVHITSLKLGENYSIDILVDVLNHLPNLNALKISSLPSINSSDKQIVLNNNKITKVNLSEMIEFEQLEFLINLCPQMEHLEVSYTNNIDPESLVRFITKHIPNLCSLCLYILIADHDVIVQKLRKMISTERLLHHYTIKRGLNRIYLLWK